MTRTAATRAGLRTPARAALAALALGLVALLLTPLRADAHAALISSTPEDGATVKTLPSEVTFTFDEPVGTPAFVAVSAPDGTRIEVGDPTFLDATMTQQIDPVDEQGVYTMSFRVVSDDGHPVAESLTFRVTSGREVDQVDPEESLADPDDTAGVGTAIVLVVTAAVAIVIVVGVLVVMTRRPQGGRPKP